MNLPDYQAWPDGTRVRFTSEARQAMQKRPGRIPLRKPIGGGEGTYTIDNTDDNLHDVLFRETGERFGASWLTALPREEQNSDVTRQMDQRSIDRIVAEFKGASRAFDKAREIFEESRLDAIRRFRARGLSMRCIAKTTSLSKSQVQRLLQDPGSVIAGTTTLTGPTTQQRRHHG